MEKSNIYDITQTYNLHKNIKHGHPVKMNTNLKVVTLIPYTKLKSLNRTVKHKT